MQQVTVWPTAKVHPRAAAAAAARPHGRSSVELRRCAARASNSGHQLLLPPADWCPMFASQTTQGRGCVERGSYFVAAGGAWPADRADRGRPVRVHEPGGCTAVVAIPIARC